MSTGLIIASAATAIVGATPVLIAATGELLSERAGIYNLGIEGIMLMGAFGGFVIMDATGNVILGLLGGAAVGAAFCLPFAFAVTVLGADMVMAGLATTFIGIGLSGALGRPVVQRPADAIVTEWHIPLLTDLPYLGEAFFRQPWLVYLAFLIPVLVHFLLSYTRHGMSVRALGESPTAVDALGLRVTFWRFAYVVGGAAVMGLGGAFLTLGIVHTWLAEVTAGRGFIALALVIFARWRPLWLLAGACLFGALATLGDVAQALGWDVPSEFFTALPYIGTVVVVAALALIGRRQGGPPPWPAALGLTFVRGAD
jgi:general nucleoside transport system permease protein